MQIQNHAADLHQCGLFVRHVDGLAFARLIERELFLIEIDQAFHFLVAGTAKQRERQGLCDGRLDAAGVFDAPCESVGGFQKHRIVEQGERLLRGVGLHAVGTAFLARRGIKVRQHRVHEGALPMRVKSATHSAVPGVRDPIAIGKLDGGIVAGRLVGFRRRAAGVGGV